MVSGLSNISSWEDRDPKETNNGNRGDTDNDGDVYPLWQRHRGGVYGLQAQTTWVRGKVRRRLVPSPEPTRHISCCDPRYRDRSWCPFPFPPSPVISRMDTLSRFHLKKSEPELGRSSSVVKWTWTNAFVQGWTTWTSIFGFVLYQRDKVSTVQVQVRVFFNFTWKGSKSFI